jgi:hypothetical protein
VTGTLDLFPIEALQRAAGESGYAKANLAAIEAGISAGSIDGLQ